MNSVLKKILSGSVVFCIVLAFSACSPNVDQPVPTQYIKITNIPETITNSNKEDPPITPPPAFKMVYVQLSKGFSATAGSVAKGEMGVQECDHVLGSNGKYTYTATIPLFDPDTNGPFNSTNWSNLAIIISPFDTDNPSPGTPEAIFSIDSKASMSGPSSSSSTVTIKWDNPQLYSKNWIHPIDYLKLFLGLIMGDTAFSDLNTIWTSGTTPPSPPPPTFNSDGSEALFPNDPENTWWNTYFN